MAPVVGFVLGLVFTPLVIRVANRYGLLDIPSDDRRLHSEPVPRLGGVAVFAATVCAVSALLIADWVTVGRRPDAPLGALLPGVLLGCTIVFFTGLLDDLRGVAPRFKLIAQTAAALAVVAYGFRSQSFGLAPGGAIVQIGWLGVPLAILWIVGITNAFNLIDGVDGLAGSFALIGLVTCVAADLLLHEQSVLVVTLAMVGAVLAFLRFNKAPARIFLGDSGSMTIGFFLAVRAVIAATGPDGTIYFIIPLVALAFPITDTFIAIARRWLRGHHLSRADGRHVHHQLLALGLSSTRVVELLGVTFAAFATIGLSVVFAPPKFTLALFVGASILGFAFIVYGVRFLQYSEFMEFGRSVVSVIRSARTVVKHKVMAEELSRRIERASSLCEIERLLEEHADLIGLIQVELLTGKQHFIGPEGQMIAPADALPWRLDYRMGIGDHARRELLLRIWCSAPLPGVTHGSAERFAIRVGPTIEQWIKANPGALPEQTEPLSDSVALATRNSGEVSRPRIR